MVPVIMLSFLAVVGAGTGSATRRHLLQHGAEKMLPTGGDHGDSKTESDWEARYGEGEKGCLSPNTGIDLAMALPRVQAPLCLTQFDDCTASAVNSDTKSRSLCTCLLDYKQCVTGVLASLNAQSPDGLPVQGCPSIVMSRICAMKEAELLENEDIVTFAESKTWSCSACVTDEPSECLSALSTCECHTGACSSDTEEASCRCDSMACLLAMMRCWVESGCSTLAAWYLCLYDTPALLGSRDSGYEFGYRNLRCSVEVCREAMVNLEFEDTAAYAFVGLYLTVLVGGLALIGCLRFLHNRRVQRRFVGLRLAPPQ
eukprot:Hpha_TRINITY_DN24021_c0_g1::TRINITY_DN24021_c0_g1_i1::g.130369::m.130369